VRILAIDPGTSCGWAIWENGDVVHAGTWDLSANRFEGGGMRYVHFERFFRNALRGAQLVAYEEVQMHAGTAAAHVYGGITAHLMRICQETGIPYYAIPYAHVKRTATGKGNSGKDAMVAAANARWGLQLTEKKGADEADARWIAVTAAEQYGERPAA
jgi:Holliday junction resolvasome RuvABC endonuclease subunit